MFRKIESFLLRRPKANVLIHRAVGLVVFTIVAVCLAEILTPLSLHAELPVIDTAAIAQMAQQTQAYARQIENMIQQVNLLQQQVRTLTGHYGMGALGSPLKAWGNTSWNDIVNMVNTGVNPGDAAQVYAYKMARTQNIISFPKLAPSLRSSNPRLNAGYENSYQGAIAGMSAGQGTFNGIQSQLDDLQSYKDQIDQTENVKAALDLNTAVGIKVGQINAEILRLNAMQLYTQASSQNNMTNGQAAQAEFFAN